MSRSIWRTKVGEEVCIEADSPDRIARAIKRSRDYDRHKDKVDFSLDDDKLCITVDDIDALRDVISGGIEKAYNIEDMEAIAFLGDKIDAGESDLFDSFADEISKLYDERDGEVDITDFESHYDEDELTKRQKDEIEQSLFDDTREEFMSPEYASTILAETLKDNAQVYANLIDEDGFPYQDDNVRVHRDGNCVSVYVPYLRQSSARTCFDREGLHGVFEDGFYAFLEDNEDEVYSMDNFFRSKLRDWFGDNKIDIDRDEFRKTVYDVYEDKLVDVFKEDNHDGVDIYESE